MGWDGMGWREPRACSQGRAREGRVGDEAVGGRPDWPLVIAEHAYYNKCMFRREHGYKSLWCCQCQCCCTRHDGPWEEENCNVIHPSIHPWLG